MATLKPPIYTLAHGIEVIGEYAPSQRCPYWRVRIRPHAFFPDAPVFGKGLYIRRSRVMLAAKLGRPLLPSEHAHHDDEARDNDSTENIVLLSAAEHNRRHKLGTQHADETRQRISAALKRAYEDGRRARPQIINRDHLGRIAA